MYTYRLRSSTILNSWLSPSTNFRTSDKFNPDRWMLNDAEDQRTMLEKGIKEVPLMSELMNQALVAFVKVRPPRRDISDSLVLREPIILREFCSRKSVVAYM